MEKPIFFTKVLRALSQLSTTKGFSIKQIAEHLQLLNIKKRNIQEVKAIVEKSMKYGIKQKLLVENFGKFHLSPTKLQSFHICTDASRKKKKKRVRFKKGKTNINDALKLSKNKRRKTSSNSRSRSVKSERDLRNKRRNECKNTKTSESGNTTNERNQERNLSEKKSNTELIEENKETKEPLDVTPDRDVHGNCENKNRVRDKQPNVTEPPHLESDIEISWQPPRPPNKLIRERHSRHSRHSSKVKKRLKQKYKHHCPHAMERRKRLKDFIPDNKMYRKYKTRSRRNYDDERSEESSDYESKPVEKICRKCHHQRSGHQRHHNNSNDYLLERKISNTVLDHLNKSRTVLDTVGESLPLTPFEVFLEANHNKLETIAEHISAEDDPVEEVENEEKDKFGTSYIN